LSCNLPNKAVGLEFKEFRIPDEKDLSKCDWSWVYDGEKLPFITHGIFFGDAKLSEAMI